jgi:hypothetical protein
MFKINPQKRRDIRIILRSTVQSNEKYYELSYLYNDDGINTWLLTKTLE